MFAGRGLGGLALCLWCGLCGLMLAEPVRAAEKAHSLDAVPQLLKTPEAKSVFKEEIDGIPAPDRLGIRLPAGLDAKTIVTLLAPDNKAPLNTVGAKPLPGEAHLYAVILCTGGDIPTRPDDMRCGEFSADTKPPLKVIVGLVEARPGSAPHLVAKPLAVSGLVDWRHSGLPSTPDRLDEIKGDRIAPTQFSGFDLAPYRIAPGERAFGLRGQWSDSYSGGGGTYNALYLFAPLEGQLRQILAAPMSSYKNIAGDWHKDGTRDHEITEGANVLMVTKHRTGGYFDLVLRARTGPWQRTYRWSSSAKLYRPADPLK